MNANEVAEAADQYGEDIQAVVEIEVSYRVRVRLDNATSAKTIRQLDEIEHERRLRRL